ncbi:uncharacterized protein [Rutidosis leptorrhynchoides]|uniref:uncharacterized protein n=1 Tax=Rutidosis leptorrhynchoides TaxID=125765 RepID=UPI003A992618
MDFRVCAATGDLWLMMGGSESGGGGGGGRGRMLGGVFSHESEHDLAAMVIDVLENGSSYGGDSRCVVTTVQVFSGLAQLADKISETSNWTVGPLSRDSFSMIGSAVGGVSNAFYGLNLAPPGDSFLISMCRIGMLVSLMWCNYSTRSTCILVLSRISLFPIITCTSTSTSGWRH